MARAAFGSAPWQQPAPPLYVFSSGWGLAQSELNKIPAHLLQLYTQSLGGWRTTKPMCIVSLTANRTIADQTDTTIAWNTELYDSDNMFTSASPTQITIQTPGWYRCYLQMNWTTAPANRRACKIMVNGNNALNNAIASDCRDGAVVDGEGMCEATEQYFYLFLGASVYGNAWQWSGGNGTLSGGYSGCFMEVEWVSP